MTTDSNGNTNNPVSPKLASPVKSHQMGIQIRGNGSIFVYSPE